MLKLSMVAGAAAYLLLGTSWSAHASTFETLYHFTGTNILIGTATEYRDCNNCGTIRQYGPLPQ
jgi:hypothetical protein